MTQWWIQGLRFSCLGCGRCCRREGAAFLTPEKVRTIATEFNLSEEEFRRRYMTTLYRLPSLAHKCGQGCIMLENNRCKVYSHRPHKCATWPFWNQLLESPEAWEDAARFCPGMNQGVLYTGQEIEELLQLNNQLDAKLTAEWKEEERCSSGCKKCAIF